ncbi:terminase small subunit [Prauserella endophytica]|uniref:Terminase small subunit actinomycetes phage-type domain-containing protein n=1 Tax=Prauserella endophytica TaxID=1592324 RepID=A0ABY2RTW7_9PSEU|nr:hypothetical protein [Prauserella endophytica]TKG57946.1 hypothetical protein FCN18_38530 [Prauserella endophytica]
MGESKPPSMVRALEDALRSVERQDRDGAVVRLAKRYAAAIDADPTMLVKLGPLLLEALRDLGMTPRSRASVVKGGADSDTTGATSKRAKLLALRHGHAGGTG